MNQRGALRRAAMVASPLVLLTVGARTSAQTQDRAWAFRQFDEAQAARLQASTRHELTENGLALHMPPERHHEYFTLSCAALPVVPGRPYILSFRALFPQGGRVTLYYVAEGDDAAMAMCDTIVQTTGGWETYSVDIGTATWGSQYAAGAAKTDHPNAKRFGGPAGRADRLRVDTWSPGGTKVVWDWVCLAGKAVREMGPVGNAMRNWDPTLKVNLIQNGSFERLAGGFPYAWGPQHFGLSELPWMGEPDRWLEHVQAVGLPDAPHGRYVARLARPADDTSARAFQLTSTDTWAGGGEVYTLSASVRADRSGTELTVRAYNRPAGRTEKRTWTVGRHWQECHWTTAPATSFSFEPSAGSTVWLDEVRFYSGAGPQPFGHHPMDQGAGIPVPVAALPPPAGPPRLADTGAEAHWRKAPELRLVSICGEGLKEATRARVLADPRALWLWVEAAAEGLGQHVCRHKDRDAYLWQDEVIELLIAPHEASSMAYHLAFSPDGVQYDGFESYSGFDGTWQVRTVRRPDGYSAVVRLPYRDFVMAPVEGEWRINVCRENRRAGEYSCWSPTYLRFHEPTRFGVLRNVPVRASEEQAPLPHWASPRGELTPFVRVSGRPVLPFGVWYGGRLRPEHLQALRDVGFNSVWFSTGPYSQERRGSLRDMLDTGVELGLGMIPVHSGAKENCLQLVRDFGSHPACWGVQLMDEPDYESPPPGMQLAVYAAAKRIVSDRPLFINYTSHFRFDVEPWATDVACMDTYPIPRAPVRWVAWPVSRMSRRARPLDKPVMAILQACGGSWIMERYPTPEEFRAMTYLALIHGARGFAYFTHVPVDADLRQAIRAVRGELERLWPPLLEAEPSRALTVEGAGVHHVQFASDGRAYLVLANALSRPADVTVTGSQLTEGTRPEPVFGSEAWQVMAGKKWKIILPALGRHVATW